MNLIPSFLRLGRIYGDLSEEMRLHIEERVEQLRREGLSPEEAERRARIAFGNPVVIEEHSREVWQWPTLESIVADVRFALRQLRRSRGFTVAAVVTLALAIGANAVVFSVLNAFLLRPLNVAHPDRLYQLEHGSEPSAFESYPDYLDLRDRNHSFDGVLAHTADEVGMDTGGGDPSELWIESASGNYFDVLGLQPYLGRFFHAADEHGANSAPYIVLSYDYWHTHFHDDRGVIGRVVQLNRHPFTIIGVAPRNFNGMLLFFNAAAFVPLVDHPQLGDNSLTARGERWVFDLIGRLKPGVTPAQAIADLNSIGSDLEKAYPKDESKMTFRLATPGLYGDYLGRPVKAFMAGLMLLTMLILLAACANLGSLFAARAADRSREVALRLALGSTRKRILRGLFTEAVLISLAGGALGLAVSVALLRALSAWRPFPNLPLSVSVDPDARVYLAALLLAIVSGLLFGAVPVRQVLRTNPYAVIKAGSGGKSGRRITARDLLLVAQITICAVLVTSSLVAVRGLERSLQVHYGFDLQHTMLAEPALGMAGYSGDRIAPMQKRMIQTMESIPGVEAVGLADSLPLGTGLNSSRVFLENATDLRPVNAAARAYVLLVSPGYFRAAGTALLSGRDFSWQDDNDAPRVAVVNAAFARRLFGSENAAIGRYYKLRDGTRVRVVGIAEDGKYDSLTEGPQPVQFLPILQSPTSATTLVVRASSGIHATELATAMRSALRRLDAGMPVIVETRMKPMEVHLFGPRMATVALGVLGFMGAVLSITGIFGMAAYSVSRRLREIGIRVALGAQQKEVLQAALGRALKMLALGSAVGLGLGLLATRCSPSSCIRQRRGILWS
jgi:predicted permease